MTNYLADTFNRGDASVLGTASDGGTYTMDQGTAGTISGDYAYSVPDTAFRAVRNAGHADAIDAITVVFGAGSIKPIIILRRVDANNYLQAIVDSGSVYFEKIVAGVNTRLNGGTGATMSLSGSDVFAAEANGTTLIARKNGTAVLTITDSTFSTATWFGFGQAASGTSRFNDFSVDSVTLLSPTATQLGFTLQPGSPVQTGTAHVPQPKVAIQDSGGGTITTDTSTVTLSLTTVTGSGTAIGTLTKVAVAGVADFSANGLGVTGTGTFKWHATDGSLTAADSATFTVQAGVVTPEQTLVGVLGGDAAVLAFYDARTNVAATSNLVQTWDDVRGSSGFGPQLVGGADAGNKPLYDSTNKTIETKQSGGTNSNFLRTATDTKFDLTAAKSLIYVGTMESGQDFVLQVQNAAHTKYGGLFAGFNSSTGVNEVDIRDTGGGQHSLGIAPSTTRILARASYNGPAETTVGNAPIVGQAGGRAATAARLQSGFAFASGSWQLVLGGTPVGAGTPAYSHAIIRAALVVDHMLLGAEWDAVEAWAVAQHSAVLDTSKKTVVWEGNSITEGVGASSGANSTVSKTMAHFSGCETQNAGVSGQEGATILATMARRSLPSYHLLHTKNVFVIWGEGTNEIAGGTSAATAYGHTRDICLAARARGFLVCVGTVLPATTVDNTKRTTMNTSIRNNWTTFADALADVALIAALSDPTNATYYGDGVHPTDAGHLLCSDDPTYGFAAALTPLLTVQVADHLAVTTQPSSPILVSGSSHSTQPVVAIKDASGVTVSGDTSTVTAALVVETGAATSLGTLTKVAVAGVANFAGNGLGATSALGATAHWHFTDGTLTAVDSATFTITGDTIAADPTDPFLVIAGIRVPILEGQAVEQLEQGGSSQRAQAGNLLSDCPWEKLSWQATTGLLTRAETTALKAAIAFRAHVTVSGLLPNATVTAEVTWSNGAYVTTSTTDGSGILRSLVLLVRQV